MMASGIPHTVDPGAEDEEGEEEGGNAEECMAVGGWGEDGWLMVNDERDISSSTSIVCVYRGSRV